MKSLSLRQRTLVGLTAIALSLGGTLEIASAATTSNARNLQDLTTTELATPDVTASANESELVAIKFKKHSKRRFKKFHGRKFKKHHDSKFKKHHGHKVKTHHGFSGFILKKY